MCLLALLVAVQLSNVSVLRFLDIKYFSFVNVSMPVSEVSHNLNLPTVCVRNWCRNFSEAFLSLTQVQKLVHKQMYCYSTMCLYYIHAFSCTHFGKLQIILKTSGCSVKNQFFMVFDAIANNIFPV